MRAFEMIHDAQAGNPVAPRALRRLRDRAAEHGWDEVERICLFGAAVVAWIDRGDVATAVALFLDRCETDGDPILTALALAMRAMTGEHGDGHDADSIADADLARAVVLTEVSAATGDAGDLEVISALTACGIAFGNRWLWELADEQYRRALECGRTAPAGTLDLVLAPVVYNLAEIQVSWASMLRQVGDTRGVAERLDSWERARRETTRYELPALWGNELEALGTLLEAIAGEDVGEAATLGDASEGANPEHARTASHLALAVALSDAGAGRSTAAASVETALAKLDPLAHPHEYDLALCVAAEIEAADGRGAGLRYAKRQLDEHWSDRQASVTAMRARIDAQRKDVELIALHRKANLDELTGLANRWALDRYVADLVARRVTGVALIIFDVDNFKSVNDNWGHPAGDQVLITFARVMSEQVRPADLAARLGGDELAAVLVDTDLGVAIERASGMIEQINNWDWSALHGALAVRVSGGVAFGDPASMTELMVSADAALYEAKSAGGGRIVAHEV